MPTSFRKLLSHEMRVLATNGRSFSVTFGTAWQIVSSPVYLLCVIGFSAMVALLDAPMFTVPLPLLGRLLLWTAICYATTAVWVALFWTVAGINKWQKTDLPLPNMLPNVVGITAAVWAKYLVAEYWAGLPLPPSFDIWSEAARYAIIATVAEFLTVAFLLPRFENVNFHDQNATDPEGDEIDATQDHPSTDLARNPAKSDVKTGGDLILELNDKRFPVNQITYLKSVEHYIELKTEDGVYLERAALRSLTEQLDDADGIQTHRSYWVARREADRLERRNGNSVLVLSDGTEIPVARSRRKDVADWLEASLT